MERTLEVLNDLERDDVFALYAIGGGMGAIFYMEPFLTYDLDVFVVLPAGGAGILTLGPLYSARRQRGYREEGECMNIEGVPVQLLPAYNALVKEALARARAVFYERTPTRAGEKSGLGAEHLVAIMLQTGRDKDRQRFSTFLREVDLDRNSLEDILRRHQLAIRWREWAT